jgi:nicotinamide-nucleotide amidase
MKKKPIIALIIIAQEILQGKIFDANTNWLARHLTSKGLELGGGVFMIGDQIETIIERVRELTKTCDVIITSGGLGPTQDDVTKKALARSFAKKIVYSDAASEMATLHYARISRDFDSSFNQYDHIPEGFTPIGNPVGLAPGLKYSWEKNKFLLAAPGVPSEFQAMIEQEILSASASEDSQHFEDFTAKTWQLPEEKIFKELCPTLWDDLLPFGMVSSLPHPMGVDIGVRINGETAQEVEQKASRVKQIFLKSPLAPHIWQFGSQELPAFVLAAARTKNLNLGSAESCTGGLIASRLTDVAGSSDVFKGSIVAYSREVKAALLEVPDSIITSAGVVSETVAKFMAGGARESLDVDVAVSTTGIAGPGGGSEKIPVGTVWIGTASPRGVFATHYQFRGNREMIKYRASQAALHHLRMEIGLC